MPPRRSSHFEHVPLQHSSVMEPMDSRMKRLRPVDDEGQSEITTTVASGPDGTQAVSSGGKYRPGPSIPTRSYAPLIRNVRRGSATDALSSLHELGERALVEERIQDRTAKSGVAPSASLLVTWRRFHQEAFADAVPAVDLLPVTVQSMVVVGAIFKRGGYRSFANHMSAIKAGHIEAGRQWEQLLSHTSGWVTRSVLRGIGPARQSCGFTFAKLCKLPRLPTPKVRNGPQQPVHLALLSTIFLLREVDASTALASAWRFDDEAMEVTWTLRGSKQNTWRSASSDHGHACAALRFSSALTTRQLNTWSGLRRAAVSPPQQQRASSRPQPASALARRHSSLRSRASVTACVSRRATQQGFDCSEGTRPG